VIVLSDTDVPVLQIVGDLAKTDRERGPAAIFCTASDKDTTMKLAGVKIDDLGPNVSELLRRYDRIRVPCSEEVRVTEPQGAQTRTEAPPFVGIDVLLPNPEKRQINIGM
jgi:hypothetical protein